MEQTSDRRWIDMSGSSSKEQARDVRQLAAAVNLFLKHSTPEFTVDTCCNAFIKTLANFIEGRVFSAIPGNRIGSSTKEVRSYS